MKNETDLFKVNEFDFEKLVDLHELENKNSTRSQLANYTSKFRKLVKEGNSELLAYLGASIWFSREEEHSKLGLSYLKSAIAYSNHSRAWYWLSRIFFSEQFNDSDKAEYSLQWSAKAVSADDKNLIKEINNLAESKLAYCSLPFVNRNHCANKFDRLYIILSNFWLCRFYRSDGVQEKINNKDSSAYMTKEWYSSLKDNFEFEKKAKAWSELFKYYNWTSRPLYLVYVKNSLNINEIMELIAHTLNDCGYKVEMCEWSEFSNINVPEDAVLGLLSDIEFLKDRNNFKSKVVQEDQENIAGRHSAWDHLEKYSNKKLWIPWGLPTDIQLSHKLCSSWHCVNIKNSLLEDPISAFFSRNGIVEHLFSEEVKNDSHREIIDYVKSKFFLNSDEVRKRLSDSQSVSIGNQFLQNENFFNEQYRKNLLNSLRLEYPVFYSILISDDSDENNALVSQCLTLKAYSLLKEINTKNIINNELSEVDKISLRNKKTFIIPCVSVIFCGFSLLLFMSAIVMCALFLAFNLASFMIVLAAMLVGSAIFFTGALILTCFANSKRENLRISYSYSDFWNDGLLSGISLEFDEEIEIKKQPKN